MRTRRELLMAAAAAPLAAQRKYRVIDPHVHVWKADPKYPWAAGEKPPAWDAPPEKLLPLMEQHGVSHTVIIQVRYYMFDNSYLLSVLRQYPGKFHGVARVNPQDPAAPDHLSKLTEQGFRGIRLSPANDASGDWIAGDLMPPLWRRCEQLKVPMTILARPPRMPDVGRLIDKHPDLTLVIDHMADSPLDQPQELEKLIALKRHPKTYVKVSHSWLLSKQPYPWRDAQEQIKRLYDAFGPQRLMWATDWPMIEPHARYEQALTLVRDDIPWLTAEDKEWMLSKTVEKVWPFGSQAQSRRR